MFKGFSVAVMALMLFFTSLTPIEAANGPEPLCFPETNQCLEGIFKLYWQDSGGLPIFGYPIRDEDSEFSVDTSRLVLAQWAERVRMESRPTNPAPYQVLLGRLGDERLRQLGIDWRTLQRANGPQPGCRWFAETGHNVCDQEPGSGFMTYWQTHGLPDPNISAYQRSLALFGFPLTEARIETNSSGKTVLTQWFERARFEWYPNNPTQYKVLLGLLGREVYANRTINAQAEGDVQGIDQTAGTIRLQAPSDEGIDTILVTPTMIITRQSDGQRILLRDIRITGSMNPSSDRIWAGGQKIGNGKLQAQYLVVTSQ